MNPNRTLIFALITAVVVLLLLQFKQCGSKEPVKDTRDSLKALIPGELVKVAELKKEAVKADSIVYKWRDRWRTVEIAAKTSPCDSILPVVIHVADSVIVVDSTAIAIKDSIICLDGSIISQLQSVVKQGSVEIVGLKKEIRKQKRQKWLIGIGAVLFGGVVIR